MPKHLPNVDSNKEQASLFTNRFKLPELPRISRFIPELALSLQKNLLYPKLFIISFISGILLIGIIAQSVLLVNKLNEMRRLATQRQSITQDIVYWKTIDQQYKGYRDVDLKLATLEYQIGNINEARQYIQKAFSVDPNTKDGRVLGDKIGKIIQSKNGEL